MALVVVVVAGIGTGCRGAQPEAATRSSSCAALSRSEVDALWDGARLALSIRCVRSGYVARRLALRRS